MDIAITAEDLTTNESSIICDPALEDCAVPESAQAAVTPEYPATDLWIFASVGLINAIGPAIYYAVSQDFTGNYGNREHSRDRVELEVMLP